MSTAQHPSDHAELDALPSTEGIPLTIKIKLATAPGSVAVPPGATVLVRHQRSDHPDAASVQGVQVVDGEGIVEFATVFPGCTTGRWPHVHIEVYPSTSSAVARNEADLIATEQLALPFAACNSAYATSRYRSSRASLAALSLDTDPVFRHGYRDRLANVTGSVFDGFVARLTVIVA